jgi:hypothetical protein
VDTGQHCRSYDEHKRLYSAFLHAACTACCVSPCTSCVRLSERAAAGCCRVAGMPLHGVLHHLGLNGTAVKVSFCRATGSGAL